MHERIRKLRRTLDLTQQEFADAINVKRNTVATYEMGRSDPSGAAVSLICQVFNVNPDWLRTGKGEMFIERSRDEEIAAFVGKTLAGESDNFKKRFISMLARLDEDDWELLEKMTTELHKG